MGSFESSLSRVRASLALYTGTTKRKKQERDKRPRDGQNELQLDDVGHNPGKTSSVDQVVLFAAVQNRMLEPRWEAVKESRTARQLRMNIDIRKESLLTPSSKHCARKWAEQRRHAAVRQWQVLTGIERQRQCFYRQHEKICKTAHAYQERF
jgi:hypothetical protein